MMRWGSSSTSSPIIETVISVSFTHSLKVTPSLIPDSLTTKQTRLSLDHKRHQISLRPLHPDYVLPGARMCMIRSCRQLCRVSKEDWTKEMEQRGGEHEPVDAIQSGAAVLSVSCVQFSLLTQYFVDEMRLQEPKYGYIKGLYTPKCSFRIIRF